MNPLLSFLNPTAAGIVRHFQKHAFFELHIVNARKTKLGDYRYDLRDKSHRITINNDLKGDAFLYTALHEIAHQHTQIKNGRFVQPHGLEWKENYKKLLLFALEKNAFETPNLIIKSIENIGFSSATNQEVYRALYSKKERDELFLEDIPIGRSFELKGMVYQKLKQNQKRSVCKRIKDNKDFFVSNLATVKLLKI